MDRQHAQHMDQGIHIAQAGEQARLLQRFLSDGAHIGIFDSGEHGLRAGRRLEPAPSATPP